MKIAPLERLFWWTHRTALPPERIAAQAMVLVSEHPHPPRHLVLGSIGVAGVATALQSTLGEIETWRATSIGCDFPTA